MHVADAQQRLNIRVVGVLAQRVDQEEDRFDLAFSHHRRDLGIAAFRAGEHTGYRQSRFLADECAGGIGRN